MAGGFFGLHDSRDLLNKLGRDYDKLVVAPNVDTLFNFFVTGWSIRDWILRERPELRDSVNELYNGDLLYCQEIGNKAKHFELTQHRNKDRPDPDTVIWSLGALNEAPLNAHAVNEGELVWSLHYGDSIAVPDVLVYARHVIDTLVRFFSRHHISPRPRQGDREAS
ncbi:hypothetical protein ACLQ9J_04585 [Bordetella hinzii]|nr:hypothetical protein [Bordetella hinzii]